MNNYKYNIAFNKQNVNVFLKFSPMKIFNISRPFMFSASITPANVACAIKSLEILEREPQLVMP